MAFSLIDEASEEQISVKLVEDSYNESKESP